MKRTLLTAFSLVLFACVMSAQDILVSPLVYDANFVGIDLTDNFQDLESDIHVTNNTGEEMEIKWTLEAPADCADEWDMQICDNNNCYGFGVISNINPPGEGPNNPFVLQAGETFDEFALHVWPRMTAGCCQMMVHFSTVANPDDIIATAYFNVSVNMGGCAFPTSTEEELETAAISVYPNPTTDMFTLTSNQVVDRVVVFNVLGKKIRSFNYFDGEYYDISDLADGLYLVSMQNDNGQVLKTMRLSKRGFRP